MMRPLHRFWRDRKGGPALEFALIAPVLATLILGVVAVGFEAEARIDAREAVRAGAHAVMSGITDPAVVRQIVLEAVEGTGEGYTVNVTQEYRCGASVVTIDATCADGSLPEEYFTIDLDATAGAAYANSPAIATSMEVRVA